MLNKGQRQILSLLKVGRSMSTKEIANALGTDIEQATLRLQYLRRKHLLSCSGHWYLCEEKENSHD